MPTAAYLDRTEAIAPGLDRATNERIKRSTPPTNLAQRHYDQAPCGHFSVDQNLRLVHINQTLLDWLGQSRHTALAQPDILSWIEAEQCERLLPQLVGLLVEGASECMELELVRQDGSHFQVMVASAPVLDELGHFLHSNSTVIDISSRATADRRKSAQHRMLSAFADRTTVRMAYYDKNLVCRYANLAQASRYGKLVSEMVGTDLTDTLRPDLLPDVLPRVANALSGQRQLFEMSRDNGDGNYSHFEVHYIPDFQRECVEGVFVELHDVTDARRIQDAVLQANTDLEERVRQRNEDLYQSEQRYRLMIDAIQDYGVFFVDEAGVITEWSESAQRLHGFVRERVLGQPFALLMGNEPATDDEMGHAEVLRLAKEHGRWETRGWRLRNDGTRFWAHTVLTALRNEAGELQGLSNITHDMTAAKNLEEVRNDLNRELEKRVDERTQQLVAANKDLDVFSQLVSHDLRSPLRHIASFATLMQEHMGGSGDTIALQYQKSIAKSSKRMGVMIEGLLEYARLGRLTVNAQPVPLTPLVQRVVDQFKSDHPGRQIAWDIEPDLPVVRGDAMLLGQVFTTLLSNAVKYTGKREQAHIKLGWMVNPVGGRTFFVQDDGAGFDLSKAHSLFVMFQRQHHSMDFEGVGTNLALTQRILERHGGRIWAETAPNQGCTFFFTLPFEALEPELKFRGSMMGAL